MDDYTSVNDVTSPRPLTAARRAELLEERRVLVAKLKRLLKRCRPGVDFMDPGNMGVPHDEFFARWDGVHLKPSSVSDLQRNLLGGQESNELVIGRRQ